MAQKKDQTKVEEARLAGTIQEEGALAEQSGADLGNLSQSEPRAAEVAYPERPYSEAVTDEHRAVLREFGREPEDG